MALLEASPIPLGRDVEMADVSVHAIERHLEVRESARTAPRLEFDLRIAGPESLEVEQQFLAIPAMTSIAPEETALWTAEHRDFTGSLISLGSLENFGLETSGFEEPGVEAAAETQGQSPALLKAPSRRALSCTAAAPAPARKTEAIPVVEEPRPPTHR